MPDFKNHHNLINYYYYYYIIIMKGFQKSIKFCFKNMIFVFFANIRRIHFETIIIFFMFFFLIFFY
jgi:hypothetical protein